MRLLDITKSLQILIIGNRKFKFFQITGTRLWYGHNKTKLELVSDVQYSVYSRSTQEAIEIGQVFRKNGFKFILSTYGVTDEETKRKPKYNNPLTLKRKDLYLVTENTRIGYLTSSENSDLEKALIELEEKGYKTIRHVELTKAVII